MSDFDNNQLFYPHPNGEISIGEVVSPPEGSEEKWSLCCIKIDEGHYGLFRGKDLIEAEIKAMQIAEDLNESVG